MFDGGSFVLNRGGKLALQMPFFEKPVAACRSGARDRTGWRARGGCKATSRRLGTGLPRHGQALRDYIRKTGFKKVLLGLSGGIDSAIVAAIAADALGPENVRCVMLPSEYTSQGSLDDAQASPTAGLPATTPCRSRRPVTAVTDALAPLFEGTGRI